MTMTTLTNVLGTCTILFKQRVANLIKFGNKGRLLILKKNASLTEAEPFKVKEFKSALFTIEGDLELEKHIKRAMQHSPSKVILVEHKDSLDRHFADVKKLKFDWMMSLDSDEQENVVAYSKENKIFSVVYNQEGADSVWVVSVGNSYGILTDGTKLEGEALLPIVAGLCAGCPYDMSITGYVLSELKEVDVSDEFSADQLMLYNDEEGVRIANPINTLMTTNSTYTEDMKDLCIMEGIKRFDTDVKYSFRTGYKGKYKNKYDNQQLFISACKGYIKDLVKADILDDEYENTVKINTDRLRDLWIASGKDEDEINAMSDLDISKLTYKKLMALKFDVKFLNAIESCEIEVEMY